MKTLMVTVLLLAGTFASAEVLKGKALETQVIKMGYCVGVKTAEGREYAFKEGGVLVIRAANSDAGEGNGAYSNDYANSYENSETSGAAYEDAYGSPYEENTESSVDVKATWSVKGAGVTIHEGQSSYDLVIGFKSKTCWAK